MSAGYYDADNIWIHGEDEEAAPGGSYSEMLNKGQRSIGPAVGAMVVKNLADDHTPALAAGAAVAQAMAAKRLAQYISGDDPEYGSVGGLTFANGQMTALSFDEYGNVPPGLAAEAFGIFILPDDEWASGFVGPSGRVISGIRLDGSVYPPASGGTASPYPPRPVINCGLGQSNTKGSALPWSAELDPDDPRHFMYRWSDQTIQPATTPLSGPDAPAGVGPLNFIARDTLNTEPAGTVVYSLLAAVGGSALVAQAPQGVWRIDWAGSVNYPALYPPAIAALLDLKAKVTALHGVAPIIRVWWIQGEADTSTSQTNYKNAFAALMGDLRAKVGSDVPVVLGGMVNEYNRPANDGIRAAHADIPRVLTRSAFAPADNDAGSYVGGFGVVHHAREGIEKLSRKMYRALGRAYMNITTSQPVQPQRLTATRIAGTLTMTWDPPYSRVTGYAPQYRVNGGAWVTPAFPTIETQLIVTGITTNPADLVECQISSTNEVGTSATSTIVAALGV